MPKKDLEMKKAEVPEDEELEPASEDEELEPASEDEELEPASEDEELEPAPKPKKGKGKKEAPAEDAPVPSVAKKELPAPLGDLIEDRRYSLRPKAQNMRDALASQPLVRTLIPRMEKEGKDAVQFYSLNGFAFYVRKGVFQNVPEQVAQLISDTYGQDANILAEHPLNLNNNVAARGEFSR